MKPILVFCLVVLLGSAFFGGYGLAQAQPASPEASPPAEFAWQVTPAPATPDPARTPASLTAARTPERSLALLVGPVLIVAVILLGLVLNTRRREE
jgi:hypothetical protein